MTAVQQGSKVVEVAYSSVWHPCFGANTKKDIVPGSYGSKQNASKYCFDTEGNVTMNGDLIGIPESTENYFRAGDYANRVISEAFKASGAFAGIEQSRADG